MIGANSFSGALWILPCYIGRGRGLLSRSKMRKDMLAAVLTLQMLSLPALADDKKDDTAVISTKKEGVAWCPLLGQTAFFLVFQQTFRIAYEKETRVALKGPFWRDYITSVRGLHGWGDGDPFGIAYLGHPWNGAVAGRLFVQNDPVAKFLMFRNDKFYWKSRLKALGWSAAYSITFELSPIGEAAIGNIGGTPWPDGMGYTDLVITPVLGTGVLIAEDLADRYVISWLEKRASFAPLTGATRTILNPARTMANMIRFKWPWYRDGRPVRGVAVPPNAVPVASPAHP